MTNRTELLQQWLASCLEGGNTTLVPASEDASFRRYFRVNHEGSSFIVMDAPPEQENSESFVTVSGILLGLGLHVPEILAADLDQGFLLLTDLGERLYLQELNDASVERLYGDAMAALLVLQVQGPAQDQLPMYDEDLLVSEMELFREWLLGKHLGLVLDAEMDGVVSDVFVALAQSALAQPRVFVHRDYHSRNLMITEKNNPGILDYQDAVIGPITYDLVSLLRDCYIAWPRERVEKWVRDYHERLLQAGVLQHKNEEQFLVWFDWMGVQRHLKAAGIFARLNHRDGKPGYLKDIPRTVRYIQEVSARYPELQGLHKLLSNEVIPRLT